MSDLGHGRELLATLEVPLPLAVVGELAAAIDTAARKAGYRDVMLHTADGAHRIIATKRPEPLLPKPDPGGDL